MEAHDSLLACVEDVQTTVDSLVSPSVLFKGNCVATAWFCTDWGSSYEPHCFLFRRCAGPREEMLLGLIPAQTQMPLHHSQECVWLSASDEWQSRNTG